MRKSKNQLFRNIPTLEIVQKVLFCFGLQNLDDSKTFSRNDLIKIKTVEQIYKLKSELEEFYLPCKARTYLNQITEKNVITILRQIIKTFHYNVKSKEKYLKGEKYIIYQIKKQNETKETIQIHTTKTSSEKCIVKFD